MAKEDYKGQFKSLSKRLGPGYTIQKLKDMSDKDLDKLIAIEEYMDEEMSIRKGLNKGGMTKMNKGMKALKKKAPAVAKKMGYSYGGSVKKPMKMNRGGMCGASNPASKPMKRG
jgi:response regulator of citrate/malate metabolism